MARIVLIHGAFNEFLGPYELKARWLPALRDGLWHHQVEIADADVEVCYYGDLFRRDPDDQRNPLVEKSRENIAETMAGLAGSDVLASLGRMANAAAFDRVVDMVTIMSTAPDLRDRMRARAEAVVGPDTGLVIAHSLGTLLSYMALCNHPNWPVHTFVTLGSPLASPMIFGTLNPPPAEGRGQWPGSIKRWVNVRATGDKACEIPLQDKFGPRVEELLIDNGSRAHDPEPYLSSSKTGAVIARALT